MKTRKKASVMYPTHHRAEKVEQLRNRLLRSPLFRRLSVPERLPLFDRVEERASRIAARLCD